MILKFFSELNDFDNILVRITFPIWMPIRAIVLLINELIKGKK